jgi:hypothetical protein
VLQTNPKKNAKNATFTFILWVQNVFPASVPCAVENLVIEGLLGLWMTDLKEKE